MMQQHTLPSCPLRSTAWMITADDRVESATPDMKAMLGYDPTGMLLDTLWQPYPLIHSDVVVRTRQTPRQTLHTCRHDKVVVCTDISALESLYSEHQDMSTKDETLTIVRLSPFGTIDALFEQEPSGHLETGIPIMRYVHNNDVPRLCAALCEATSSPEPLVVPWIDLQWIDQSDNEWPCRIRVAKADRQGNIMCMLMLPHTSTTPPCPIPSTAHPSRLWTVAQCGLDLIAQSLAQCENYYHLTWQLTRHDLAEIALTLVQDATSRPELDPVFRWIEWAGSFKTGSTRAAMESYLNRGAVWLATSARHHYEVAV